MITDLLPIVTITAAAVTVPALVMAAVSRSRRLFLAAVVCAATTDVLLVACCITAGTPILLPVILSLPIVAVLAWAVLGRRVRRWLHNAGRATRKAAAAGHYTAGQPRRVNRRPRPPASFAGATRDREFLREQGERLDAERRELIRQEEAELDRWIHSAYGTNLLRTERDNDGSVCVILRDGRMIRYRRRARDGRTVTS